MLKKIVNVEAFEFIEGKMKKLSEPTGSFGIEKGYYELSSEFRLISEILSISAPYAAGLSEVSKPKTEPGAEVLPCRYYRHYLARCREIEDLHYYYESIEFDRHYDILNENVLNCRN